MSGLSNRQLALRRDAIGGSEVAVLAGLSSWASPIEIFEAKVLGAEKETTDPMLFVVVLEEPIAQVYAHKTGKWLRAVDTLINGKYPMAIATPDRAVFSAPRADLARRKKLGLSAFREAEKGLEIKSSTWRQKERWGAEGSDFVPDEYAVQVTWHMGVTGVREWDLAVLFDRDDFRVYRLRFDAELFEGLYVLAEKFMREHVIPRKPPPPDASEQYASYLDRAWRRDTGSHLQATDELERLVRRLLVLKACDKAIAGQVDLLENQLKALLGEASGVTGLFGRIDWKREKERTRFDAAAAFTEVANLAALAIQALPEGDQRAQLQATLAGVRERHTTVQPGNRPLRTYPTKETKAELEQLADVYRAALPSSTTQDNPQDNEAHP